MDDRSPLGLEPAALSVREPLRGKGEAREVREHAPRALEALLELRRDPAERRRARRLPHPLRGVVEDRDALVLVLRRAVGTDERERLARGELARLERADDPLLLAALHARERVRDRRLERPHVEPPLDRRREVSREREPTLDPPPLPPEEVRDRALPDARPLEECLHHARLVHGRHGPARRVRREDERVHLFEGALALEHDWHLAVPERAPPLEALEAVHELEEAVAGRHRAGRKLGEVVLRRERDRAAQSREARPHALDRHRRDEHQKGARAGSSRR